MKRLWRCLLPVLLVMALLPAEAAAENGDACAAVVAQFRQGGALYILADLEEWPDALGAELKIGDLPNGLSASMRPTRLPESGLPVSYLLLVDCSTSMRYYKEKVDAFAEGLASADKTGAAYEVASFGDGFHLLAEGLDAEAFVEETGKIVYDDQRTDLSNGILDAVDYLTTRPRQPGELVNLVVVTDGVPKDSDGSPALSEAAEALEENPSILVHTIGVGGASDLTALGRGAHVQLARGARAVAGMVNGLCAIVFPWEPEADITLRVILTSDGEPVQTIGLDTESIPVVGAGEGEDEPAQPDDDGGEEPPPENDGEEGESPDKPGGPPEEDGPDAGGPPEEDDPDAGGPPEEETPDPEGGTSASDPAPGGEGAAKKPPLMWILMAVGVAAVLLLAAAVLLTRRKKGGKAVKPAPGSIFMRLEVISGDCATQEREFYLADQMLVGRGRHCDLAWKDQEVSAQNTRIFLRDGLIYIEDLGSEQGTALGGMRLHGPNRLRSGDEISIGPVRFRLKF